MFRAIAVLPPVPFDRRHATSLPLFGNAEHYRSMPTSRQWLADSRFTAGHPASRTPTRDLPRTAPGRGARRAARHPATRRTGRSVLRR
jgi:hypothetical protein